MNNLAWPLDWKPDPTISAEMTRPDQGEPPSPPACKGCPAYVTFGRDHYCGRPPCYHVKARVWGRKEIDRISKKTGIPVAEQGRSVKPLFDFNRTNWDDHQRARALMEKKPKGLVLIPGDPGEASWDQERVIGSPFVSIGAEDPGALLKLVKGSTDGSRVIVPKPVDETDAQRAKRLAKRRTELERNVLAMEQWHRDRADSHWLIDHTAKTLGPHLAISGPILAECETELTQRDSVDFATGFTADERDFEEHIAKTEKQGQPTDDLRRAHILYCAFVKAVFPDTYGGGVMLEYQQKHLVFGKVAERILSRVVGLELNKHLPKDWAKAPIHHTPLNCWECGRFGRDPEQLTFTELKQGWVVVGKPEAPTAVYCPDHKPETALAKSNGKVDGKVDGKHAPSKAAARISRETTPKGKKAKK
jgi:hypothetical protein